MLPPKITVTFENMDGHGVPVADFTRLMDAADKAAKAAGRNFTPKRLHAVLAAPPVIAGEGNLSFAVECITDEELAARREASQK